MKNLLLIFCVLGLFSFKPAESPTEITDSCNEIIETYDEACEDGPSCNLSIVLKVYSGNISAVRVTVTPFSGGASQTVFVTPSNRTESLTLSLVNDYSYCIETYGNGSATIGFYGCGSTYFMTDAGGGPELCTG